MERQAAIDGQLSSISEQVNDVITRWRQGDVLRDIRALRLVDLSRPLSSASEELRAAEGVYLATDTSDEPDLAIVETEEPLGYAIISQTCDVIREVSRQPYIQICPVCKVSDALASQARKAESTLAVWLPELGDDICVDLTRAFTAEKSVLIGQEPAHGVISDDQIRRFAMVVSRRFGRFAFPDDLHNSLNRMRSRLLEKHGRDSDEGFALRNIYQIRAEGYPDWSADLVEVILHFILEPGILLDAEDRPDLEFDAVVQAPAAAARGIRDVSGVAALKIWAELIRSWIALCEPVGAIKSIEFQVTDTENFTLEQMRRTEQLDLDHLSLT
ncbi:hypothetical protein AB0I27_10305 [Streptomyces sp. NPDC050597]|uniref:hypothetical protein n=1 Tax=Streptomyces sp. NPDC050597 TaxID=3157212 RepID=UPI0034264395